MGQALADDDGFTIQIKNLDDGVEDSLVGSLPFPQ
jgi:hypothetical protein